MMGSKENTSKPMMDSLYKNTKQKNNSSSLKTILVVEDNTVNRKILSKILSEEYKVLEAENGQEALKILSKHVNEIVAIMLDLIMPIMNGYEVLEALKNNSDYNNLPIVVTTDNNNNDSEIKALSLGAWDFVSKPYNPEIIKFRLKNVIDRSQLSALNQLKYLAEYDALTGIYNKTKFFDATRQMIDGSPDKLFVFLRFDVDRFQLINSFFGTAEGDKLLIYIAQNMAKDARMCEQATYGRIESDIVGFCLPYNKEEVEAIVEQSKKTLAKYNTDYDIVPSIGIYVIDDTTISVEEMYNRSTLAAKTCKGNYVDFYAYYNKDMSTKLALEQEITNEMKYALENGQFEIYLQPQYNIHTNLPCGAEALVRWRHPEKGIISPGEFIPIFEQNGFISKLDYYVWEEACKCLQGRLENDIRPYPISVNVSRVNLYNPNLVDTLLELVDRYQVNPSLLNLELTESAYTDNPTTMKKVISQLQSKGFLIMMDDFGSGYSSLSLLKDIVIDVLKIDMLFLSKTEIQGRGENIIASVIRMAKWLNIPVIAEGAETLEQVDFLRSVGCDYVQGYYFARPMPIGDYEKLCIEISAEMSKLDEKIGGQYRYDDLFSSNAEMKELFGNALQPAVIYEFVDDKIEMIRVNEAYYALLGHDDMLVNAPNVLELIEDEYKGIVLNAFRTCVQNRGISQSEYVRSRTNGNPLWIHTKLSYASIVGNKYIIIGELTDITMRKELDSELQKYKESWLADKKEIHTLLIVDDVKSNRDELKEILKDKFSIFEAKSDLEAIEVLTEKQNIIDLILLNISISHKKRNNFLQYKKNSAEVDTIPIIMITDNEQKASTYSLGATDYISRPLIPEVVIHRVQNVLDYNYRFKKMVKEYNEMSEQVKIDQMTGLVNRVSAEEMVTQKLKTSVEICAMFMLDIDNFKKINDSLGHDYGDKVICAVADTLRKFFRKEDIIARMGGDEFVVFMANVPDKAIAEEKAYRLCEKINGININSENVGITCSVGIAFSSEDTIEFKELYQNSDKALYSAKCHGRNTVSIYGEKPTDTSIVKWINDAEGVLNAINDCIYVCDLETYELIYANDGLCNFCGVTKEQCKGKKCYEIIMGASEPCSFCPLPKISEDKIYTRLFRMPGRPQTLLMRGKNINRNGSLVHLEVAVDVTKVENIDTYWEENIDE
ncbi:MAG: EAL domain-containing protein [Anaerovoracaceae bacterium]